MRTVLRSARWFLYILFHTLLCQAEETSDFQGSRAMIKAAAVVIGWPACFFGLFKLLKNGAFK